VYDTSKWHNIVDIAIGYDSIIGLKADGKVIMAYGKVDVDDERYCDTSNWTDIVVIAAGLDNVIGLKSNGTLMVTGWVPYEINYNEFLI